MIKGSEVRLKTMAERQRQLEVLKYVNDYMQGREEYPKTTAVVANTKAPNADYTLRASLVMVAKEVFKPIVGIYEIEDQFARVKVPEYEVSAYFFCRMFLAESERRPALYERLVKNKVRIPIPIPSVPRYEDGQLKIMTDLVIAIDHMVSRTQQSLYNILVVGSSAQSGRSSTAYGIIPYMKIPANIKIELYDPYNREMMYKEHVVVDNVGYVIEYIYHRSEYVYSKEVENYDMVLDDAYVMTEGVMHSHRATIDPERYYTKAADYSIKRLPGDAAYFSEDVESYEYAQALRTVASETRMTRYPRLYRPFVDIGLGLCTACIELGYMLRRSYGLDFVKYFLQHHKRPCQQKYAVYHREDRFACCEQFTARKQNSQIIVCSQHQAGLEVFEVNETKRHCIKESILIEDLDELYQIERQTVRLHYQEIYKDKSIICLQIIENLDNNQRLQLNDVVLYHYDINSRLEKPIYVTLRDDSYTSVPQTRVIFRIQNDIFKENDYEDITEKNQN